MLVFTRNPGERIVIGGGVVVTVLEVGNKQVRLGITAPDEVRVDRGEVADERAQGYYGRGCGPSVAGD